MEILQKTTDEEKESDFKFLINKLTREQIFILSILILIIILIIIYLDYLTD